jgi:hypothetical protein
VSAALAGKKKWHVSAGRRLWLPSRGSFRPSRFHSSPFLHHERPQSRNHQKLNGLAHNSA